MADLDPKHHGSAAVEGKGLLVRLSHELRTPLNAAYQFVTIVLDDIAGPLSGEQREYLEIVLRNIDRLRCIIGDLLEVTRIDEGRVCSEPAPAMIGPIITDVLQTLSSSAAGKRVSLNARVPEQIEPACMDPRRLRRIMIHLVENAVKFTPAGGSVTVQAFPCGELPGYLCVSVTDTGCGIENELHEKIFDRAYQAEPVVETSRKGLGMGLYICREMVRASGGRIWVNSKPAAGSTFSFTIPVWSRQETHQSLPEPASSPRAR